jgi:hypothetical protein
MGKTTLVVKLILAHYRHFVNNLVIISSTYPFDEKWKAVVNRCRQQKIYSYTSVNLNIMSKIYQFLLASRRRNERTLLVIDDMTREMRSSDQCEKLYNRIVANNRWFNTSIVQSAQKVVHVAMEMRLNWDNLITFYPDNQDEVNDVYKTCGRLSKPKFERILRYCTKEPYSFMYARRHNTLTSYYHNFTPLEIIDNGQQLH